LADSLCIRTRRARRTNCLHPKMPHSRIRQNSSLQERFSCMAEDSRRRGLQIIGLPPFAEPAHEHQTRLADKVSSHRALIRRSWSTRPCDAGGANFLEMTRRRVDRKSELPGRGLLTARQVPSTSGSTFSKRLHRGATLRGLKKSARKIGTRKEVVSGYLVQFPQLGGSENWQHRRR
jgi:hypothetical protein